MVPLHWRDSLSLNVPVIDRDHKRLIDLLNRVHYVSIGGDGHEAIASALDELVAYTRTHFSREEMLMRLAGYPGYETHRTAHERLTAQADRWVAAYRRGPDHFDLNGFYDFVADWIVSHIMSQDMKIRPFVEKLDEARAA
jgi:hemerythrin-like metal-binding protein